MLKIESASAIYLQYTYSRMLSILSKSGEVSKAVPSAAGFEKPIEFQLALRLSLYPEVLLQVIRNDVPHLVSDFVEELASEVNRFYAEVNVLSTEGADLKWSRLCLLRALLCCMRNAMGVLNVGVVEKL
jgi:arginyl-tRNA synthetase